MQRWRSGLHAEPGSCTSRRYELPSLAFARSYWQCDFIPSPAAVLAMVPVMVLALVLALALALVLTPMAKNIAKPSNQSDNRDIAKQFELCKACQVRYLSLSMRTDKILSISTNTVRRRGEVKVLPSHGRDDVRDGCYLTSGPGARHCRNHFI